MNSLYEPHLFGSCIRELGKSIKGSPLFVQWHPFSRKEERKKRKLSPSIYLSFLFISKFPFFSSLFSCCVQKGNSILLFNFTLYNNFTTRYQHESALEKVTLFYFVQKSFSIYHIVFTKNIKNFISQFYCT